MKRVYLFFAIFTFFSLGLFAFTFWKLPPQKESGELIISHLVLFSLSLIFSLCGIFTFLIFSLRRFLITDSPRIIFRISVREAFFSSLILASLLLLQKIEALTILNILLIVFIFVFLEIYFLLRKKDSLASK